VSLSRSIFVGTFVGIAGPKSLLKITQGGVTTYTLAEQARDDTNLDYYANLPFVWEGNVWVPSGHVAGPSLGWVCYNPNSAKIHRAGLASCAMRFVQMAGRVGMLDASDWQSGPSPLYRDVPGAPLGAFQGKDHAMLGPNAFVTNDTGNVLSWAYPFNGAPTSAAGAVTRLCPFNGVMYGIDVNAGACFLRKWEGGAWVQIGAGFTPVESADIQTHSTQSCFFEFNGKLWLILCYNTGVATQWVRCYELNTTTGGVTEHNAYVPAAWQGAPAHDNCFLFEVIDDAGGSRQVFLTRCGGRANGAWEMYEFSESAWSVVHSGVHILYPYGGAVWDEGAGGVHIHQSTDSVPSSYATLKVATSDIQANANINIDPRYQVADDTSDPSFPPVHTVCDEKLGVGSEGKTALATKPTGFAALADLDDDFADGVIDADKWEIVNAAIHFGNCDYGAYNTTAGRVWYDISETLGRIALGGAVPASVGMANCGIGIRSRWSVSGAFQIDATLAGLAALSGAAAEWYKMVFMVKCSTNKGYGIYIWNDGANCNAKGFSLSEDAAPSISGAAVFNPIDGSVLRIARDGANVWALTVDPTGANENVLPAGTPNHTGPVRGSLLGVSTIAGVWASATPGPGFSNFAVAGAGALNLWYGQVTHDFMWDHVSDLGAGINNDIQFWADSN